MLLAEIEGVLRRPRMRRSIRAEEVPAVLAWVIGGSLLVDDPDEIEAVCRDRGDDYIVALAKTHDAAIVTGDGDLQALKEKAGVIILTAKEYVDLG
jgi:predicted nucleic acid-binding protein